MWYQMVGAFRNAIDGTAAAPSYTGPGDIVSGAAAWWGLRGYTAAYSTGSNPAIDVVDAATGLITTTVNILSNGALDTATILGLGYAVKVKKIWDQSGNGNHLPQTTLANMPDLSLNVIGSLPAMLFTGANSTLLSVSSGMTFSGQTLPVSVSAVVQRTGTFTSFNTYFGSSNLQILFTNSANTVGMTDGDSIPTATASDSAFHAIQSMVNGASSKIYVDGSLTTSAVDTGNIALGGDAAIGASPSGGGSNFTTGYVNEIGLWAGDKSASNSSINSNQHAYWGF